MCILWELGVFAYYNYYQRNIEVYGQPNPPSYQLNNITVPTVLFCAAGDNIVTIPVGVILFM